MNRVRRYIAAAAVVLAALPCGTSCFKKVSHDTRIILRPNLQSESGGTLVVAQGVEAYACNKGELWFVRSYDDAVNRVVTNTTDGSIVTLNDVVEAQPYERNGVEGLLSMRTKWAHVMMVAVYPAAKMYAWRHYATAENLPETWIAFQFRPWKSSGYVDGEWHVEFAERDEDNGGLEESENAAE